MIVSCWINCELIGRKLKLSRKCQLSWLIAQWLAVWSLVQVWSGHINICDCFDRSMNLIELMVIVSTAMFVLFINSYPWSQAKTMDGIPPLQLHHILVTTVFCIGSINSSMSGMSDMSGMSNISDGFSSQVKHWCTTRTHMVWPSTLILHIA